MCAVSLSLMCNSISSFPIMITHLVLWKYDRESVTETNRPFASGSLLIIEYVYKAEENHWSEDNFYMLFFRVKLENRINISLWRKNDNDNYFEHEVLQVEKNLNIICTND